MTRNHAQTQSEVLPVSPAPSIDADQNQERPSRETWFKPFPGATVLAQGDAAPAADGSFSRVKIVYAADFKYPYIREVETLSPDPATGALSVVRRESMVADHLLLKSKPGLTEEGLRSLAGRYGFTVMSVVEASASLYMIGLSGHGLDDLPQAIEAFKRDAGQVAYAEPDHIVMPTATFPNDSNFSSQ